MHDPNGCSSSAASAMLRKRCDRSTRSTGAPQGGGVETRDEHGTCTHKQLSTDKTRSDPQPLLICRSRPASSGVASRPYWGVRVSRGFDESMHGVENQQHTYSHISNLYRGAGVQLVQPRERVQHAARCTACRAHCNSIASRASPGSALVFWVRTNRPHQSSNGETFNAGLPAT